MIFKTRCLSSLSKVFADRELIDEEYKKGSALRGEVYSFQIAYYSSVYLKDLSIELKSDLSSFCAIRHVVSLPANFLAEEFDDNVLQKQAGLFPELLREFDTLKVPPGQWQSIWITVKIPENIQPENYNLNIVFNCNSNHKISHETLFRLEIGQTILTDADFIFTNWLHPDCIMTHYNTKIWSQQYWDILEKYMINLSDHGANMILTPLFTLPLDTEVGHDRPTSQLVKVRFIEEEYSFDFSLLERWINLALKCGFKFLEMSHLFTQWGAEYTPKIIAATENGERQIFGWHVKADSVEYKKFIDSLMPALTEFLKTNNYQEITYFHISDEPELKHIGSYKKAVSLLKPHLEGFKTIDALSNIEFYKNGLIKSPVPILDKLDDFIMAKVTPLWCYYCGGPQKDYSNRLFHFPAMRNRILGIQMFKYDIKGFLHWGYNFWYTQFSKRQLNPFWETDAGLAFPAGDSTVVYPGESGPMDSIRWEVFHEALQDFRALKALENQIGRAKTLEILEQDFGSITMTNYPNNLNWILNKRKQINDILSMPTENAINVEYNSYDNN